MLTIVIANPIHTIIVMAEPRTSAGAVFATSAENCGESAAMVMPQKIINAINPVKGKFQIKGESKQQRPEHINASVARFELPIRVEKMPPA